MRGWARWVLAVGPWCAVMGVAALRYAPPPVVSASAPADVFSAERAASVLEGLLSGIGAHPTGSAANARVRERLVALREERGWETSLQEADACGRYGACARVVNVVARLPGASERDGELIALSAHYDSVPAGPGAADDGAGVAALVEIARILAERPPRGREVVLLFTDGEELGLLGAEAFVSEHPLARRVELVVNLEARGVTGPSLLFRTSEAPSVLVSGFGSEAPRPVTNSVAATVFALLPNDTDLSVFLDADMQGMDFAFIGDPLRYHTREDDLAHLDRRSLQHHGDNALAAVRALTDAHLEEGHAIVWADVLALVVVHASVNVVRALAVIALVISIVISIARRRSLARVALGAGALLGSIALAFGLALGLALATATAAPWSEHGAAFTVAAHAIGVAAFVALAFFVRRSPPPDTLLGVALALSLGAVALAFTLPGTSYVLALPALVASVFAALRRTPAARAGALAATVLASLLIAPFGLFLYDALGHLALAGIAPLVAIALGPSLALVANE